MKLALGTVQFGLKYGVANSSGQVPFDEVVRILALAKQHEIAMLDTAAAYGASERMLGQAGVNGFEVVTKVPPFPENRSRIAEWVEASVRNSLDELQQPSLKAVLLHRPRQLLEEDGEAAFDGLLRLKAAGLVEQVGVSIADPSDLDALAPRFRFDIVQAPLNILDRRLIRSGWLDRLKREDVEVHTRSAFLQGLLLMPRADRPGYFSCWNSVFAAYDNWLADNGISALQACLGYALQVEGVDKVVVGADSAVQLEQTIEATAAAPFVAPAELECADERLVNPACWTL